MTMSPISSSRKCSTCSRRLRPRTSISTSIHQPWGGVQGQAADISIQAKEILRMRDRLNEILALATGRPIESIAKDTDRDFFMSAAESRDYGLVDEVVKSRRDPDKKTEKSS